jgi:F0F1-type ATP synthase epsilon subunit
MESLTQKLFGIITTHHDKDVVFVNGGHIEIHSATVRLRLVARWLNQV